MNVKLISITQSLIEDKILTAEELIVYIARVSNPSNQLNTETADKLLAWLLGQHHWSPFEMADFTVEIVTSRAIAAQILRHRTFYFQEFSQRYAEVNNFEPVELRKQAVKNRQSSEEAFDFEITIPTGIFERPSDNEIFKTGMASEVVQQHVRNSQILYKALLEGGVAKECARMVLPLTTQTTLYMKGPVRNWIHYLVQRTSKHTQLEHRMVAEKILPIFQHIFPNIYKALQSLGNF